MPDFALFASPSQLPPAFTHSVSIAMGLIVGSFTNVIVARLPHGQSVVKPRSRCPGCDQPIQARDNIPVLSYLLLGGKCRNCKSPISVRYPVIELLCALLFLAAELRFGFGWLLFARDWPFVTLCLAITFIDLEHRIIPDRLSLGGLALGLLSAGFVPDLGWIDALIGAAIGFTAFYALAIAYEKYSGKAGLGGGDVKLLAMLGAFVGPMGVFATVLISSIAGSLIGIAWAIASRRNQAEGGILSVAIPYGPFLVLGGLYYYFLGNVLWFQFTTPM